MCALCILYVWFGGCFVGVSSWVLCASVRVCFVCAWWERRPLAAPGPRTPPLHTTTTHPQSTHDTILAHIRCDKLDVGQVHLLLFLYVLSCSQYYYCEISGVYKALAVMKFNQFASVCIMTSVNCVDDFICQPMSYPVSGPGIKAQLIPNLFAPALNTGYVTIILCPGCAQTSKNRLVRTYKDNSTSCLFYLCPQCTHFNAICQSYVYQKATLK